MIQATHSRRRADRGTLIARASVVAAGLAASVGLQLSGPALEAHATGSAGDASSGLCANASGSLAFE
jgi:hypothetical protein